MRAMGPGSVSSLLKTALDVVYVVLWGLIGACVLIAVGSLFFPGLVEGRVRVEGTSLPPGAVAALALFGFSLYLGGILLIVGRLRRVFATLSAGDPFHPENVRRLRIIGLILAALAGVDTLVWIVGPWFLPAAEGAQQRFPDLIAWFSVLVVFVLAEVFREGARLRREAELTI